LLPWINNHPSMAVDSGMKCCPNCGDTNLVKKGYAYSKTRAYQQYRCKNCGKWCRGTRSIESVEITEVAA
jgi:transposase-like protein